MEKENPDLTSYLSHRDFSGVVSIYKNSEVLYSAAFGYRDIPNKISNNTETKFGIASGTKTLTAVGILKLIDSGKITLDTQVLQIFNGEANFIHPKMTIRHLLNHTSGIYDYFDEERIEDFDNYQVNIPWFKLETPSDYLPLFDSKSNKFVPGEKISYSNGGYVLLGIIIEKITGNRFRDYMENEIFAPIGMSNTGFWAFNDLPENTAWGYKEENNRKISNIYQLPIRGGGDGGCYTNSEDLNIFWKELFSGNIISSKLLEKMLSKEVLIFRAQEYGLGIYISKRNEEPYYFCSGSDCGVGFTSAFYSSLDIIINILSNSTDGQRGLLEKIEKLSYLFS